MTYRVELKPSVVESLAKIPLSDRKKIARKIDSLIENPRPRGVVKLAGEESLYRIRSGDYRIIYQIQDEQLLVLVVRVGQRGDVYRHL
jgi:mRNA interferase RelE/StbE